MAKYTPAVGIETHVQLKTKTKLFSGAGNDARGAEPNTLISHIDAGMPGALPVLNEKALELAVRAAFALNTKPQKNSYFERKHYFYPDSPMGYQISQLHAPIIVGGSVEIVAGGQTKSIGIDRAQLEADAGKNTHPAGADYTLVDLNRAGTPLLEIVSKPEIHSAAEAKAYVRELYLLMKYADVSDVDLYHGNMRFDVNVSVSPDPAKLGTRAEVKNLNSFRAVEAAVEYEIKRQTELLDKGEPVTQETRGWDEDKQKTTAQRTKEEAQDYRYMPEPDIPPIELSEQYVEKIKKEMPNMPKDWRRELGNFNISGADAETLLDVAADEGAPNFLSQIVQSRDKDFGKFVSNTIINITIPFLDYLKTEGVDASKYDQMKLYRRVFDLIQQGKLSSTNAKSIICHFLNPKTVNLGAEVERSAIDMGFIQVSDEEVIEKIVAEVLAENKKAAEDVKNGELKAIGFLVGQVMGKSKGQANPGLAQKIIKKQLEGSNE